MECGEGGCLARHFIAAALMLQLLPGDGKEGGDPLLSPFAWFQSSSRNLPQNTSKLQMMLDDFLETMQLQVLQSLWVKFEQELIWPA